MNRQQGKIPPQLLAIHPNTQPCPELAGQAHPEFDGDNNNGKDNAALDMRPIRDWTLLPGANVEIRQQGTAVCSGYVDAVTDDGKIIWVTSFGQNRKIYEKDEFYEAWATEDSCGFHYKITADSGPGIPCD